MSLKDDDFHRAVEADRPDYRTDNTVSGNGCYAPCSESDSESESEGDSPKRPAETLRRFWSKVNRNGPIPAHCPELGACWLWTANTVRGYGQFTYPLTSGPRRQAHVYAHRFAYELTYGPLGGPAFKACHRCDNTLCVRPDHLFRGTQPDNLADARRKGRLVNGLAARKLTDDAYREILSAPFTRGHGVALAQRFGVTETTISRIRRGHQGVTFRRMQAQVLERVPHRELSVRGEVV